MKFPTAALWLAMALFFLPLSGLRASPVSAAESLARRSGCLKCHGIEKTKDGPSFREVAAKYKGKPNGVQKVTTQITTSPKVKIDGREEDHEPLKSKDPNEIKGVAQWILSR